MHQERHHRVIRRHVDQRFNTTSLEKGLSEDLAIESLRCLKEMPVRDGFIGAHDAPRSMVRELVTHLGCSGNDVKTCVEARAGAVTVHRSDVALYSFDDGVTIMAGDVLFFASSREWGECAFVTAWNRVVGKAGFWKFEVLDDIVRVPIRNLCGKATAHIGATHATMLNPPALNVG